MRCPFCGEQEDRVIDSRVSREGEVIRRRRECVACGRRFTTYERVEDMLPLVVKKDGRRESFDRLKILAGLKKACEKRPVSADTLERIVDRIEARFQEEGPKEVPSREIGEAVMAELQALDAVAYVRFASVYREFRGVDEFVDALREFLEGQKEG
ncbi:transcriptional regulator NrdR [Deferrisoma camini]|uniref:transcriptional regulator NrdR n=1 Tax=Deferrisoma camini TaxID=1035120 RepID=UPI00046CE57E|nr:transcriptional regulator NrdR [Deferrisoma camini]NOY45583.1 transcriptional repressor NrdR [Deltaproteobacteria bacterium]